MKISKLRAARRAVSPAPFLPAWAGRGMIFTMKSQIWTVSSAALQVGIHRITLYKSLKNGTISLKFFRIGRRIVISDQALMEFLAAARPGRRGTRPTQKRR
ncbi:MAG: MerR family transcriptional regulator [Acidiferrobacterales bacterium]